MNKLVFEIIDSDEDLDQIEKKEFLSLIKGNPEFINAKAEMNYCINESINNGDVVAYYRNIPAFIFRKIGNGYVYKLCKTTFSSERYLDCKIKESKAAINAE